VAIVHSNRGPYVFLLWFISALTADCTFPAFCALKHLLTHSC